MNLTLYTDASYSNATGVWGTGFRAVCDLGRLVGRQVRVGFGVSDSITAELAAIAHALHRVELRWGDALDGRTIHVRTDCSSLLPLLTDTAEVSHRWRSRSPGVVPVLARIRTVVARRKLSLDAKHVRAHQPRESSTEAWLNDSVDRLARAAKSASRAWRDSDARHGVAPADATTRPSEHAGTTHAAG